MVRLSVEIAGLRFRTPILTGAGPVIRDSSSLLVAAENGIGGLVTGTITSKPSPVYPYLCKVRDCVLTANLASPLSPESWEREIPRAKRTGLPLIANIGFDLEDIINLAPRMIEAGADGIEITLRRNLTLHKFRELVKEARKVISEPLFVKLNTSMHPIAEFAKAAAEQGVDGLTVIDAVGPCTLLRDDGTPFLGSEGGIGWLCGPAIKPMALRALVEVAEQVEIPIFGAGGVLEGRDVAEFIMAGAWAVQVNSAVILRGPKVYGQLVREFMQFMQMKNVDDVGSLRGATLRRLPKSPLTTPKVPTLLASKCNNCGLCARFCFYDAIRVGGKMPRIEPNKCTGCGLCVSVCPAGALRF